MIFTSVALSFSNVALSVELAISNEIQHMEDITTKVYMYRFIKSYTKLNSPEKLVLIFMENINIYQFLTVL